MSIQEYLLRLQYGQTLALFSTGTEVRTQRCCERNDTKTIHTQKTDKTQLRLEEKNCANKLQFIFIKPPWENSRLHD